MLADKEWLTRVGWLAYALTWITLLANIVNDWLTRQWISPLSIVILAVLSSGTIIQFARGEPVIQTEGAGARLASTLILILLVLVIVLGWTISISGAVPNLHRRGASP